MKKLLLLAVIAMLFSGCAMTNEEWDGFFRNRHPGVAIMATASPMIMARETAYARIPERRFLSGRIRVSGTFSLSTGIGSPGAFTPGR